MNKRRMEIHVPTVQTRLEAPERLTLAPYVHRRNMLIRSFGAGSFGRFWQYRNTPRFFLLGVGVVVGRGFALDFSEQPWWARAGINLTYILVCLAVTLVARHLFAMRQTPVAL